jgi:hypothetical protein
MYQYGLGRRSTDSYGWLIRSDLLCMFNRDVQKLSRIATDTLNQLLFADTLFRDSSVMNWIAATNFRDRAAFF